MSSAIWKLTRILQIPHINTDLTHGLLGQSMSSSASEFFRIGSVLFISGVMVERESMARAVHENKTESVLVGFGLN